MLTFKLKKLLIFIDAYITANGIAPSYDDMRKGMELQSKSSIHRMVSALVERGFLRQIANHARAIEVIKLPGERSRGGLDFMGVKFVLDERVPEGEVWIRSAQGLQKIMEAA